jgi:hypothetical protein
MSLNGVPRHGERVGVAIVSIILHTYNGAIARGAGPFDQGAKRHRLRMMVCGDGSSDNTVALRRRWRSAICASRCWPARAI